MIQMRRFVSSRGAGCGDGGHAGSVRSVREIRGRRRARAASSRRKQERAEVLAVVGEVLEDRGADERAEHLHDASRSQFVGRRIRATADERDVVRSPSAARLDEVREQAGLALEDATEALGLRRLVRSSRSHRATCSSAKSSISAAGAGHERLFEVGRVGAHRDAEHRVLLRGEVVEERAAGHPDLRAELLDREPGQTALGGEPPRLRLQCRARSRLRGARGE